MITSASSRRILAVVAIAALTITAAGCASDDGDDDSGDDVEAAASITVDDAWARSTPAGRGAVYFEITSTVDDELVSASVDPSIAATVEIHETVAADGTGAEDGTAMDDGPMDNGPMDNGPMGNGPMATDQEGDMPGGGMMRMREVTSIALPAGEAVVLAPGGLHVMLLDMPEMLEAGSEFELTLVFATADPMTVTVTVRDA